MKYMGIDFGTKRIGIAVSDEGGEFAFPKKIIENGAAGAARRAMSEILEIISAETIGTIVIGNSLNAIGEKNPVMKKIESFVADLRAQTDVPVVLQDERFSSIAARSMDRNKSDEKPVARKRPAAPHTHIDDRAAAILLQRYLDIEK